MRQGQPTLLVNATVVTGDGTTIFERGIIRIREGVVTEAREGDSTPAHDELIIDANGCTIIPGIINAHAHGCTYGPSMPSGSRPFVPEEVTYQKNRHLLSGTTSLVNVCGLALPDEINPAGAAHPLQVIIATAHTPANIEAALAVDGKGLGRRHRTARIDDLIAARVRILGEAGGGQTLGGGAQDYRFIPDAIRAATGQEVHPTAARRLKEAVLGRHLDGVGCADDAGLELLLSELALGDHLTAIRLRDLVRETVMPPVELALQGLREVAKHSARLRLPAIFHNAVPTAPTLLALARRHPAARMIAGHSNHPSFLPEEAVHYARLLRDAGVVIDASTLDCISTRWRNDASNLDALIEAGLVDTLSTDFAGGDWDSILSAIQRIVHKGQLPLPAAIALATGNVARSIPEVAGDRGILAKGKRADIVVCESHNLARVRHVLIAGRVVVRNGMLLGP